MRLCDVSLLIVIVVAVVAAAIGYGSSKYLGDDNPVEEAAEEVIEADTGIDIDLTPGSKEKSIA
jgi:hypothetical protein